MTCTWRSRVAPGFEKACVVKRLTPETLEDPERVKRFRREAEIVRSLSHGAIAQTIAVDDYAGEPFIVQEYIEGKTLTQFVSAARSVDLGALPVEIAIQSFARCRARWPTRTAPASSIATSRSTTSW